jgi:hypothetical protein
MKCPEQPREPEVLLDEVRSYAPFGGSFVTERSARGLSLDEYLDLPFATKVLGIEVTVEKIELHDDARIVAICARGRLRQAIGLLDLPRPSPPPAGAEWIEAYRLFFAGR